jgi:hypothetical protein
LSGLIAIRRVAFLLLLLSSPLLAQNSGATPPLSGAAQQPQSQPTMPIATGQAGNSDLAQMRDDLNKMESLNMNMSSEIEFLHDQNLQILLRTNSQMWTILIRDLRRQLSREEQQRATTPPATRK